MMKSPILFLAFLLIDISSQCEDRGGETFCLYVLRKNDNMCDKLSTDEVKECMKTCGGCTPSSPATSNNGVPVWAVAPRAPGPPRGPKADRPEKSEEDGPLALPLYAVILIIVACLVIFIGVTVCVIKLKRKWRKRKQKKIDRNRQLLKNAPVPANTMPHRYVWTTGSHNGAYHPDMDAWVGSYYPEVATGYHSESRPLNNSSKTGVRPEKKNINILQNGAKDKRKAPEPPKEDDAESAYQNLDKMQKNKTDAPGKPKSRAPAPPPAEGKNNAAAVEIPVKYSESVFSEPTPKHKEQLQKESCIGIEPPTLPPRGSTGSGDANEANPRKNTEKRAKNRNYYEDELSGEEQDDNSDVMTLCTDETLTVVTDNTQDTSPALANILNEWKEHLQEQKKELEEYYRNLHAYVKRLGLKPADANQNDRATTTGPRFTQSEKAHKKRNRSEPLNYADRPYESIHENYIGTMKFPEPPESVRGDFDWKPKDEASQRQVIVDLKKKLSRLQNLLESTQEAADVEKKSPQFYQMPSQHSKPWKQRDKDAQFESRVTIKVLLQKLEERSRLKVQMRIAQALDTAKRRGGMNIGSRDGPITCLSKQIHHVMNDILDPRTSTKIELGAHAASTLANKLLSHVHANLLPILGDEVAKREVGRTCDRISILTKQLLDMTKQLMARQTSYQAKDYNVFVNALVDTTEKIMDATFHLMCLIVDLQKEERRDLLRSLSHTMPTQMRASPRQSLPPQTTFKVEKDQLLSRLRSESNCTSLSAVDVRRLNHDLAKLRQLLNTETKIPSFSGITTPRDANAVSQRDCQDMVESELNYEEQDSDCDTMSTLSCSTCMPDGEDPYFYYDDLPPAPFQPDIPDLNSLVVGPKRKPDSRVQYTEIVFDEETHRPLTRPLKDAHCAIPPLPLQNPVEIQKPLTAAFDHASQVESAKDSQVKASTLDPSSFASFQSDHKQKNDIQPRHQAMLARYFGNEVPQPDLKPVRPVDNLKESLQDQLSPLLNAAQAMPIVGENDGVAFPAVTMLPCGLVANDTPPMVNPPKEKRMRMPKIPKITVLRNGESETPPPLKEEGTEGRNSVQTNLPPTADINGPPNAPSLSDFEEQVVQSEVHNNIEQPCEIIPEGINEYSLESPKVAPYSDDFLEETKVRTPDPKIESSKLSSQDGTTDEMDSLVIPGKGTEPNDRQDPPTSDSDSDESYKTTDDMLGQSRLRSSYNAPLFDYPNDSEDGANFQGADQRADDGGITSEYEYSGAESRHSSNINNTPSPSPLNSIQRTVTDEQNALNEGSAPENVTHTPKDTESADESGGENFYNATDARTDKSLEANISDGEEKSVDDMTSEVISSGQDVLGREDAEGDGNSLRDRDLEDGKENSSENEKIESKDRKFPFKVPKLFGKKQ